MLVPCSSCSRHVRAESACCPFCSAKVSPPPTSCDRPPPREGFGRADLVLRGKQLGGASLVAAAFAGCITAAYGAPPPDTGPRTDASSSADGGLGAADAPASPDSP